MAEVGLLPFARIALQVCRAVLPRYRSRFSKHQFNQPQLLAILCLIRYEDWTFREAEVRLGEHRELRQALGLVSVPDFTTPYRFLQRLDEATIDRAVGETVRRLRGRHRKGRRRARVAVDATGLAQGAVSTFFVRRMHHHGQKPLPWRHWLKWVVVVDLDHQFLLSQIARRGPWNDCANLPAVIEAASQQTRIGLVLADAEFDSERNHTYIRKRLGAQRVIPAKRGKKTWRVHGVRAEMRSAFPRRLYRRRALIESLFSSVKRKLSDRAPGRSLRMQMRQALLLGLSFNLYRLKHRRLFQRMSTEPKNLLERNIFVGDFRGGRASTVRIVRGRGMTFEVIAARAGPCAATGAGCGCAFGAAAEHAKVVGDNFEAGALLAFLVLPFAGLDAAFDEDERALLEILLRDLRLLAPDDDFVPLGALLLFAVAVFVGFVRGYGEIGDGLAAAGVARFGIASQTANENNFVYRH